LEIFKVGLQKLEREREQGRGKCMDRWHSMAGHFPSAMQRWFTTRLLGQDRSKSFVWMVNKKESVVKTRKNFRRKGREVGINAIVDQILNGVFNGLAFLKILKDTRIYFKTKLIYLHNKA
jgi:hypothetical protein